MIILAIKTNSPQAELFIYEGAKKLTEQKWQSQGILADTINQRLEETLNKLSISLNHVDGVVCFKGPGSFTGLRIGLSVGNALAYAQNIPIVATNGANWLETGVQRIQKGKNERIVTPYYDRPAATTKPKN